LSIQSEPEQNSAFRRYIYRMALRTSRTNKLSYIEETPKHRMKLRNVARASVRKKIQSAQAKGLFITYTRGSQIVREYPNGEILVIGHLNTQPIKVERGGKYTLPARA
jgi:hypothetical protein